MGIWHVVGQWLVGSDTTLLISAAGAELINDADAAAQRATLGLDADLATLSLPASTTITAAAQTVLDDTTVVAMLATLGGAPSATAVVGPASVVTDGGLAVFDTTTGKLIKDGSVLGPSVSPEGHHVTVTMPNIQNPPSGTLGLHISKDALVATPAGLMFDIAGSTIWEMGLDSDTTDMVVLSTPTGGLVDQIRVSQDAAGVPYMVFGPSVGSPSHIARLKLITDSNDTTCADALLLEYGASASNTGFIKCYRADTAEVVFKVDTGKAGGVKGQTTIGNANPTGYASDMALRISSPNAGTCGIYLNNTVAGGKAYSIVASIPGVTNGAGFSIVDCGVPAVRLAITGAGNVGIGTGTPLSELCVNGGLHVGGDSDVGDNNFLVDGNCAAAQFRLSALNTAPANAGATGTLGEIRITANTIYVCAATNTWVKAALATWA